MSPQGDVRVGILGAGRSRNGLGPFLAAHLAAAGCRIVAVAGRDQARTEQAAEALTQRLGGNVDACGDVRELLDRDLDAFVIAAPEAAHLGALQAALAAGVPVLCEKPLVTPAHGAEVDGLLDAFLDRGLLLVENCQWPEVLPAFRELYPESAGVRIRHVAMRLSPIDGEGMLAGALSHLLSVVQALAPISDATGFSGLRFPVLTADPPGEVVEFDLTTEDSSTVACRLELYPCAEQPRPAWLAIDGDRMDREIDPADYTVSFRGGQRLVTTGDPLAALVYRFVRLLREADNHERIRDESDRIRHRARLFHGILDAKGP